MKARVCPIKKFILMVISHYKPKRHPLVMGLEGHPSLLCKGLLQSCLGENIPAARRLGRGKIKIKAHAPAPISFSGVY